MKIEALLKSGDAGATLRSLEHAEQRLKDVRVNSATDKMRSRSTSPQREATSDYGPALQEAPKADEDQEPGSRARSLPFEELDISPQLRKIKSNRTSLISESSSLQRVLHFELKALKEQEERQTRSEKLKREAKQSDIK